MKVAERLYVLLACALIGSMTVVGCGGESGNDQTDDGTTSEQVGADESTSAEQSADEGGSSVAGTASGEVVVEYRELVKLVESVENKEDAERVSDQIAMRFEALMRIVLEAQGDPAEAGRVADQWHQSEVSELEGRLTNHMSELTRNDPMAGAVLARALVQNMGKLSMELAKAQEASAGE